MVHPMKRVVIVLNIVAEDFGYFNHLGALLEI